MICPHCQHEIDVATLSCPRCFAAYPRGGVSFGLGLRAFVTAGALMLVFSVILADCVLTYMPGGVNSSIPAGSAQRSIQPMPDMKSAEVGTLLGNWDAGRQNADHKLPGFVHR